MRHQQIEIVPQTRSLRPPQTPSLVTPQTPSCRPKWRHLHKACTNGKRCLDFARHDVGGTTIARGLIPLLKGYTGINPLAVVRNSTHRLLHCVCNNGHILRAESSSKFCRSHVPEPDGRLYHGWKHVPEPDEAYYHGKRLAPESDEAYYHGKRLAPKPDEHFYHGKRLAPKPDEADYRGWGLVPKLDNPCFFQNATKTEYLLIKKTYYYATN